MADKAPSALTAAGALDGSEILHVVKAGNSRRTTAQAIADLGGGAGWDFDPPLAASFTLTNSDGTNLTLADDADVGLTIDSGAGVTGAGQPSRLAYRTLTTPTSAWDMVVKLPFWMPTQNYSAVGVFVYNSTSNRSLRLYSQSSSLLAVSRYSAMGTWASDLATPSIAASAELKWLRIVFDGTDYKFYVSAEGKLWSLLFTEPAASYLNASGGNGDRVGIYMMVARTTGPNVVASVPYFSLTGAGV